MICVNVPLWPVTIRRRPMPHDDSSRTRSIPTSVCVETLKLSKFVSKIGLFLQMKQLYPQLITPAMTRRLFVSAVVGIGLIMYSSSPARATSESSSPFCDAVFTSEPEKWAHDQICRGDVANFNEKEGHGLDSYSPAVSGQSRLLSGDFLEKLLAEATIDSSESKGGLGPEVKIVGADLSSDLHVTSHQIRKSLRFEKCRFYGSVFMDDVIFKE